MASSIRIKRSIFDRLTDDGRDTPEGLVQTCSIEHMRDAVARDLERLLNTRTALDFDSPSLGRHAGGSVLCFGVRDFVGRVLSSAEDRRFVARSLSHAIEAHEPRLRQVVVDFNTATLPASALRFTIRALMVIRPARESVSFDAELQPALSKYRVTHARFSTP